MNTFTWRYKIRLFFLAALVTIMASSAAVSAAQFIETTTPDATQGSDSGGGWGNLLPGSAGRDATPDTEESEGDVYVLPSSSAEVVIGAGVTTSASTTTEVPDQLIIQTDTGLGAVAVLQSRGRPLAVLESYVGGFSETMDAVVEIDSAGTRDLATGIYRVETDGDVLYMYISVDAQSVSGFMVVEVMLAEAADMEDSIVQMRENVSINGVAAFFAVDEQDIGDTVRQDEG